MIYRAVWYAPPDLLGTYYGIMLSATGLIQIAVNSIVVELMLTYAPAGLEYVPWDIRSAFHRY